MSYPELRHHLIRISLNKLDPSSILTAESQEICKHHLHSRSHCSTQYYSVQDSTRTGLILRVALRNQNRLLHQMSYPELRHHLISISLNELDPSNDPLAESQRIRKHHLQLRSHRITTEETTLAPTCTEPSSLLTIHGVPITSQHRNLMTPVHSYRTAVLPDTSSRQSL